MIDYEAKMHDPDKVKADKCNTTHWFSFEKGNYEIVVFVSEEQARKVRDDLNRFLET